MIVCGFKTLQLTDSNGNCEAEIQRRIGIAKRAMTRLCDVPKHKNETC